MNSIANFVYIVLYICSDQLGENMFENTCYILELMNFEYMHVEIESTDC